MEPGGERVLNRRPMTRRTALLPASTDSAGARVQVPQEPSQSAGQADPTACLPRIDHGLMVIVLLWALDPPALTAVTRKL
jgi:hypothetical protein